MPAKIDEFISDDEVQDLVEEFQSSELIKLVRANGTGNPYTSTHVDATYAAGTSFSAFSFSKLDQEAARHERDAPQFKGDVLLKVLIASPVDLATLPTENDPVRLVFSDRHTYEGRVVLIRPFLSGLYKIYIEEETLV